MSDSISHLSDVCSATRPATPARTEISTAARPATEELNWSTGSAPANKVSTPTAHRGLASLVRTDVSHATQAPFAKPA